MNINFWKIQKFSFLKIARILMKILVFTFALQPAFIIYKSRFFTGLLNSFTVFSLSWFDFNFLLVILALGLAFLFERKNNDHFLNNFRWKINEGWLGVLFWFFLLIMIASVFFATDKILAILNLLRWTELFLIFLFLKNQLISKEEVIKMLLYALALQAILVVFQFIKQSWLGLKWIGEPDVNTNMFNVAKINLGTEKWLRAYGTFAHPNILSAFGILGLALVIRQTLFKQKKLVYFLPVIIILFFSFSRTAWLAALIFILALFVLGEFKINWKLILLGIGIATFILFIFNLGELVLVRLLTWNNSAWGERAMLFKIGIKMVEHNLLGVGLGNYVLVMKNFVPLDFSYWLYQPVHNLYVLMAAEIGITGLGVFIGILGMLFKKLLKFTMSKEKALSKEAKIFFALLTAISIMGLFDHYFFTNLAGEFILIMVIYFADSVMPLPKDVDNHLKTVY